MIYSLLEQTGYDVSVEVQGMGPQAVSEAQGPIGPEEPQIEA